jgi:hypothetical protein
MRLLHGIDSHQRLPASPTWAVVGQALYSRIMSRRLRQAWVLIVLAIVSCDLQDVTDSESVGSTSQSKDTRPLLQAELDSTLQALVDDARADLVRRLARQQIDAQHVAVLQAERVTWRSAALGCPLPDRGYKMVLTPGVLIRLRAAATTYEYHSTLRGPPFLCEPPGRIETPAPGGHSQDPT